MTAGIHHQRSDWEQQLELLSAYLDNEVDERERAALEQHLPTCEDCRRALQELGQSRALLRALQAPALPRSFLLPEAGAIPEPLSRGGRSSASTLSSSRRTGASRARALQWIGGLVAALGLFLLISTTLIGGSLSTTASKSLAASSGGAGSAPASSSNVQTRVPSESASGINSPTQLGRPTITATPGRSTATASGVSGQPGVAAATPTAATPATRTIESPLSLGPLAGAVLLIGGTGLLVGGTIRARRRSRRQP